MAFSGQTRRGVSKTWLVMVRFLNIWKWGRGEPRQARLQCHIRYPIRNSRSCFSGHRGSFSQTHVIKTEILERVRLEQVDHMWKQSDCNLRQGAGGMKLHEMGRELCFWGDFSGVLKRISARNLKNTVFPSKTLVWKSRKKIFKKNELLKQICNQKLTVWWNF